MQWIMDILQLVVAGVILAVFIYVQFFSTKEKRGPLPRNAPADSVTRRIDRREFVRGDRRLKDVGPPAGQPERRVGPRRNAEGAGKRPPTAAPMTAAAVVEVPAPPTPAAQAPALPDAAAPRSLADLYQQTATIAPVHTYTDRRQRGERRTEHQQGPPAGTQERRQGPRRVEDTVNPAAFAWMSETDSNQLRQRLESAQNTR